MDQCDAEKPADEMADDIILLCSQMHNTIAKISLEEWKEVCEDLRNLPDVWNPKEVM